LLLVLPVAAAACLLPLLLLLSAGAVGGAVAGRRVGTGHVMKLKLKLCKRFQWNS
jgi:hypothetical protein